MEPLSSSCSDFSFISEKKSDAMGSKMKPSHNAAEPSLDPDEYVDFMESDPVLKRISEGVFSWAGDGSPNDAHFKGKLDFLSDPQFQGDNEINYFRKTNTDMVAFLQTEGWLCLIRIRKVLRMLNIINSFEESVAAISQSTGHPVDAWGRKFERAHPNQCRCTPCAALKDVKKQLQKKNISAKEINLSVIHHIRRCVFRVLISGVDRIFETFCARDFSIVWYIIPEEFDEHYRDTEFEKLASLILNDVVAIEPITSLANFGKLFEELHSGASDLARAVLHKFSVILGSQKMFYTTSMNFIMFYIESFNMIIRMLRWMETKFRVFSYMANQYSDESIEDKLDFKSLILNVVNQLAYGVPDVVNRRKVALKVIAAYQKLHNSYFGPPVEDLRKYLDYMKATLYAATNVFQCSIHMIPYTIPPFKVPKKNVIDAALYINPYRDDQFDAPQVFRCFFQDRFIVERSQTPWKILYNNKAKLLLRLTVENPADKNRKLAINVFLAEEAPNAEDRIKDQYFALYESRLERVVELFDVLRKEVNEYYSSTNNGGVDISKPGKTVLQRNAKASQRLPTSKRISVPVKVKRPDKRSRQSKEKRMAVLSSLIQKDKKQKKPSTIENIQQLLTFAVKTGLEGSGMLLELAGDEAKDVYVSITSIDKVRRATAEQELSLHELMSFIIFSYARHGCVTEFEGHTLHRSTFGCAKSSFKESFPLLYKAAEELDAAVGEGLLSDNDLAILEKGLSSTMNEEEIKRCKKGLETTLLMKKEFNELVQSKRAFTKMGSSGFCVTLSGPVDGSSCLTAEAEIKMTTERGPRKVPVTTTSKEMRNRMRKTLEERDRDRERDYLTSTLLRGNPVLQAGHFMVEELTAETMRTVPKPAERRKTIVEQSTEVVDIDVDELVQLIEGTQLKNDHNPKKAAKKARQKEKKELERQQLQEEQERQEQARLEKERKRQEEVRRQEVEARRKLAEEEKRLREELIRKQREAAESRKNEQRRQRMEQEQKIVDEKKLKKEAKKQRREQRKQELEEAEAKAKQSEVKAKQPAAPKNRQQPNESLGKTEAKNGKAPGVVKGNTATQMTPEKEYGRLKHEKEQRKREEEEARRLEQLQEQERAQATKKSKKKKKKSKQTGEPTVTNGGATSTSQNIGPSTLQTARATSQHAGPTFQNVGTPEAPMVKITGGQPLMEILNASQNNNAPDTQGKNPDEKSNLVTIRKHMDSSVTISMRGKEGEQDLVYTLMNGQVYPTGNDGKMQANEALPLQQTGFAQPEYSAPNGPTLEPMMSYNDPPKTLAKQAAYTSPPPSYLKENSDPPVLQEIDLSQLKLPPGITITRVPQNTTIGRSDLNGVLSPRNAEFFAKPVPPHVTEYPRPAPSGGMSGGDSRYNSNIMIVDSRCSSLESPVTGIRSSENVHGAIGTRPSSEASIASDRPSSGMDSFFNTGAAPFVPRTCYQSMEMLNKHVPISMTSPFAAVSPNESPSPTWQHGVPPHHTGFPGMMMQTNNGIAADRHGLWSSTPASPVSFPHNGGVPDGYLRAQDHQFIKPRPQQQHMVFPATMVKSPPAGLYNDRVYIRRTNTDIKPFASLANNKPVVFRHSALNGSASASPAPYGFGGGFCGDRPVVNHPPSPMSDQWTPWNERLSPEPAPPEPPANGFFGGSPFTLHNILKEDVNVPWESTPCEKPSLGPTNPFGPIGSNITKRTPPTESHGHFEKMADGADPGQQRTWAYNPSF